LRYRSFSESGQAISALSLSLDDDSLSPAVLNALVVGGLEAGVNCYEARVDDLPALYAIGRATASVERRMVVVGLRVPLDTDSGRRLLDRGTVIRMLQEALRTSGLRWIDYLMIEDPQPGEFDAAFRATIEAARQARRLRFVGVRGNSEAVDKLLADAAVDIYAAPYNLRASWITRSRMRTAIHGGLTVIGYDYYPAVVRASVSAPAAESPRRSGFLGFGLGLARAIQVQPERPAPYHFLDRIREWDADQICLAYALTEPSLCTIQISATSAETVTHLASVVERELPAGVPAQIELARVSDLD
jgi:aryl-alcohol dehydrogenase-like predicted oxidoreductase